MERSAPMNCSPFPAQRWCSRLSVPFYITLGEVGNWDCFGRLSFLCFLPVLQLPLAENLAPDPSVSVHSQRKSTECKAEQSLRCMADLLVSTKTQSSSHQGQCARSIPAVHTSELGSATGQPHLYSCCTLSRHSPCCKHRLLHCTCGKCVMP